jgi:outer membrane murein-binding lipoprotein Lpp
MDHRKMSRFHCAARLLLVVGILLCGGCGNSEKSLWQKIKDLGNQKSDLAIRVEKLEQENQQLRNQVKTLQGLDPNERLAAVDVLEKIAIGSRTGLYDKDGDGTKESLVVYIEPTDIAGDRVKAAGRVDLRLWNLDAEGSQNALLKEWRVQPEQLKGCWAATLMTHYYRLTFGVADILKPDETGLVVKVKFVDYVSGKVLEDQRAVK